MYNNSRSSGAEYTADYQRNVISYNPPDGQNRSWATYGVHIRHSVSAQRGNFRLPPAQAQRQSPSLMGLIDQFINAGGPPIPSHTGTGQVGYSYDLSYFPQQPPPQSTYTGQAVSVERSTQTGINSEEYNTFHNRCKDFLYYTTICSRMIPSWTRETIKNKYATAMDQVDEYDIEATDEIVKQAKQEINTLLAEYMRNNAEVITARTYAIHAGQDWCQSIGRDDQIVPTDEELWRYANTEREPTF